MKKIKILLILVVACLCHYVHAQVEFNVRQLSNCNEFQVSLTPNTTYSAPFNLTNSAQITLVVPTGSVTINNLTTISGNWSFTAPIITAPSENPSFDYINFQLTNSTAAINYQAGIEVPLFTFTTIGNCITGNMLLMENNTDPFAFPNSQNVNVGNAITVFGAGGNAYSGNYYTNGGTNTGTNTGTNPSTPSTTDCLIEYQIEQVGNNLFQVSLTPDTTWTGINAITSTAQVSIRVPSGSLNIGNLTNSIPTAVWTLNSSHFNPPENPGWDYYSFGLEFTQDIPYNKGVKVSLFQFENLGTCSGNSIVLIDNNTDPLMHPNSQNANIEQQITVSGFQMEDAPVCIAGDITTTCSPTNQPLPANCLIEYQIEQIGNNLFQVSLTPDTTWIGFNAITSTAQVSIRVPSGSLAIGNFMNNIPTAVWTLNSSYFNPPENPGWDYYSFGLEFTQDIPYNKGVKVNLFQFENLGICTGNSIVLIDNDTDPLMQPNSQNANIEQQITVSGWQMEDVPVCVAGDITTTCSPTSQPLPANCLIEYQLEALGNNLFQVSLTPDTTWTGINALTATGQVSIRVPAGSFIMGNLTNNIPTAIWTRNSSHFSPPESPAWDYYSFGLEFTQDIPYNKGIKVDLFQFENLSNCTGDSIFLIDNATDPLMQPNSQNANIEQQITISGWQMEDVPICISDENNAVCCCSFDTATPPPNAIFDASRVCMGEATQFTCPTNTNVTSVLWNFGDGFGTSNLKNPTYTYAEHGTYEVSLTLFHADGTNNTLMMDVIVDPMIWPLVRTMQDTVCIGECVRLQAQGGDFYNWSPTSTIDDPTFFSPVVCPTATTTYTVIISNGVGCTATGDVTVYVADPPAIQTIDDISVCEGESATLGITTGEGDFQWGPVGTIVNGTIQNAIANPTSTTEYCVTLTDAQGCTASDCMTVTVLPNPIANAGNNQELCAGNTAQLNATGGISYQWSPATNITNTAIPNPIVSPSTTTDYCVTVTDNSGCTSTDCVTITVNGIATFINNDAIICAGQSTLLSATGGVSYDWSPSTGLSNTSVSNPTAAPITNTTYCVTITNTFGCTEEKCVLVTVNSLVTANAGQDVSICQDQPTQLFATGGSTYRWSPTNDLSNASIGNPIASPSITTTYCVTATDSNGCTDTDCVEVLVENNLIANAGQDQTICRGANVVLNASGGSTYRWSPSSGLSNATVPNPVATPSATTTYCVTITDNNGCVATDCVNIIVEGTILVNAGSDITLCRGNTSQLNASGGTNYIWSPSTGLSNTNSRNPIITATTTTTYCVTVTDNAGCEASDCVNVIVENETTANAGNDVAICSNGTAQLVASGGVSYQWAPSNGLNNTNINNPIASPNTSTNYCVTVTSAKGCTSVDCVQVNIGNSLTANAGLDQTICTGTTTQLAASGGSTYRWLPTSGLSNPNIANPTVNITTSTTYCVTVTDGNGCTGTDCVNINMGNSINANILGPDINICNGSSTQLTASGGSSYRWSPTTGLSNANIANPTVNVSSSTTYCVTVTNGSGCTGVDCINVNVGGNLSANAGNDISICEGSSFSLNASGGSTYRWSPTSGLSNPNIANPTVTLNSSTTYCVTVTDANGCSGTDCVNVSVGNDIFPNAGTDRTICIGTSTTLNATGGTSYSWTPTAGLSNPNIANPTANPSVTTIYCVNVSNGRCSKIDCVQVNVSNGITASAGSDISICNGSSTTLNASGGSSYRWSPTSGLSNSNIANPTVNVTVPTTYCVTVTDISGCTGVDCVNINFNGSINANAGSDLNICSGTSATLNASGGSTYRWSPTSGLSNPNIANPTVNISTAATYCVTVTDNSGCTGVDCVNVNIDGNINANAGSDRSICSGQTATLSASGGTSYSWTPTAGLSNPNIANPTASPSVTTIYCVNISNGNCSKTDCVQVNVSDVVTANAGDDRSICNGASTTLNASGGSGYRWSPSTGLSNPNIANPAASVTVSTTYCVTVTDNGKCAGIDCVTVNVDGNLIVNAGSDLSICSGSSATLNASGGTTYRWSPSTGLSNPNIANPTVNVSAPITYCVTATDNRGCSGIDCVNVSIGSGTVTANAGADIVVCTGNSARLNASGGISYQWSPTLGLNNANIASPTVTPTVSNTYCVTVTNANGCTAQDCVFVSTKGIQTGISNDVTICEGGKFPLVATGGTSYSWTPSTGLSDPNIAFPVASPSSTTTYCVNISAEGCSTTECVTVSVIDCSGGSDDNSVPITCTGVNAVACPDKEICIGEEAQLVVNGGNAWSWSPANSLSNPFSDAPIATPSITTTYTVTVTDLNGCIDVDQVTVYVGNCGVTPSLCNNITTNVVTCEDKTICPGETIQLTVTTGIDYQWLPVNNLSNPFSGVPFASPSNTTTYSVTVTDINGCTGTDEVTVFVSSDCSNDPSPQPCTATAFVAACEDKFICRGGSIRLTVTTGAAYQWSPDNSLSHPNVGAPTARPLTTTTYTVTLTDTNGCTGTDEVIVYVNEAQAFAGADVSTCGNPVQLNASGGNTYSWSPATGLSNTTIANPIANPSSSTVYCVSITDLDGCTATDCVEVIVGSSFPAVACEDKFICQGENITLTVTTGSAYRWSPGTGLSNINIGTPVASPSQTTTYFVSVTDEFGCTTVDEVIVNVDPNCTNGRSCPEGILPTIPMTIDLSDCQASGELCLPIESTSMSDYIFKINGVEQTEDAFKDCQLNYSFAYTYFTVPDRGKNGPYNLTQWIVDGNNHGGSFQNIEELINLMNSIDPKGNWEVDESTLIIKGGNLDTKYSTMSIEQMSSNATAVLDLNTNITPSETILILPIGTNEVEVMLKETGCIAQASISVICPNEFVCSDLFMEERIERVLTDCEELIEVCLEYPLLTAADYTYLHNGVPYQGGGGFCSLTGTTTALYVGLGEHELIVTHIATGCSDTLFVDATCLASVTSELEPDADTDEVITNVNETIDIDVSANDRALGVVQSIEIILHPTKGQVEIREDNSISYEPNEDYCDTELGDKFRYKICNEHGCDVADVLVKVACEPLSVYSGFSPNGDGINDYFKIEGVEAYPNSTLQVFNRWGTLVYRQKSYQNDWDGRYKSNPLADGVYFYIFMDGYGNKQSGYIQINR